jgi:hypothetical protein
VGILTEAAGAGTSEGRNSPPTKQRPRAAQHSAPSPLSLSPPPHPSILPCPVLCLGDSPQSRPPSPSLPTPTLAIPPGLPGTVVR